jgi:hypothetical protein
MADKHSPHEWADPSLTYIARDAFHLLRILRLMPKDDLSLEEMHAVLQKYRVCFARKAEAIEYAVTIGYMEVYQVDGVTRYARTPQGTRWLHLRDNKKVQTLSYAQAVRYLRERNKQQNRLQAEGHA